MQRADRGQRRCCGVAAEERVFSGELRNVGGGYFFRSENATDGGAADPESACDRSLADACPEELSDLLGIQSRGWRTTQSLAVFARVSQSGPDALAQDLPLKLSEDR